MGGVAVGLSEAGESKKLRRTTWPLLLGCILAFAALWWTPAWAQNLALKSFNLSLEPPANAGKPIEVHLAILIANLPTIDEVNEQYSITGFLIAGWVDPRLAATKRLAPQGNNIPADSVWRPEFEFINAVVPHQRYDTALTLMPGGRMRYFERFSATLSSKFDLRRFPFDSQTLILVISPFANQLRTVNLVSDQHGLPITSREVSSYTSLAQWNLTGADVASRTVSVSEAVRSSEVRFSIHVERRYQFYIWKVFLPLIVMVLISWGVLLRS
jgi:Neurotransmitter-gated ion-channel ligand binding domain